MNEHEDAEAAAWEEYEADRSSRELADPKPAARIRDHYALHLFRLEHLGEPCEICERRPGTDPHHKTFRSQGGGDVPENLLWLCRSCHDDIHAGRASRYHNER